MGRMGGKRNLLFRSILCKNKNESVILVPILKCEMRMQISALCNAFGKIFAAVSICATAKVSDLI